ncbi:hypothetical protein NKI86_31965, partial [Mesorhizobium sp. M0320]|uniref:hypothetical protein n=1 Tax=Mesorhizobium sp. M0320 TaxID=2956936 RepID=UPI00333D8AF0
IMHALIERIDSDNAFDYHDLHNLLIPEGTGTEDIFARLSYELSQIHLLLLPTQLERAAKKMANLAVNVLEFSLTETGGCASEVLETTAVAYQKI